MNTRDLFAILFDASMYSWTVFFCHFIVFSRAFVSFQRRGCSVERALMIAVVKI